MIVEPDPLTWKEIVQRLSDARYFWVHTTSPYGAPNATPVWGVVLDDAFYIYTESGTRKARNLRANSRVIVHLESAEDVLIVHGHLDYLGHPSAHQEVVSAFARKYDRPEEAPFLPSAPFFDMLYALQPLHAMAWSLPDTEASTRRWRAGREGPAGDVSGSPAPSSHTDAAGAN